MDKYLVFVSVVIALAVHSHAVTIDRVSIDAEVISDGDSAAIRCHYVDFAAGQTINWWKRQGDNQRVQMGFNTQLNDVFHSTGRYVVTADLDGEALVMTIQGAKAEDSGEIGCNVAQSGIEPVYTKLHVVVPVDSMRFASVDADGNVLHEYSNELQVEFREGDEHLFKCVATGSNPAPELHMTLGEYDLSEYFDITNEFEVVGGDMGLQQIHYTSTAVSSQPVHVASYANAMDFRCTAKVPYSDDASIGIVPSMKFKPSLQCPRELLANYFDADVMIKCRARANPALTGYAVYWMEKGGRNVTLYEDGDEDGHHMFHATPGDIADETDLVIHIDRAFPQTFKEYHFVVRSDLGVAHDSVLLSRDPADESTAGSATSITATFVGLLLPLLLLVQTFL